jgi:hypothetical protein
MMLFYKGNETGQVPGVLPGPPAYVTSPLAHPALFDCLLTTSVALARVIIIGGRAVP